MKVEVTKYLNDYIYITSMSEKRSKESVYCRKTMACGWDVCVKLKVLRINFLITSSISNQNLFPIKN